MKKIINSFIPKGNIIITDGAVCYSWLNNTNSGYTHHGHKDFGEALDSTSHVGQLWNYLKSIIKKFIIIVQIIIFLSILEKQNGEEIKKNLLYITNSGNINLYNIDYISKSSYDII